MDEIIKHLVTALDACERYRVTVPLVGTIIMRQNYLQSVRSHLTHAVELFNTLYVERDKSIKEV